MVNTELMTIPLSSVKEYFLLTKSFLRDHNRHPWRVTGSEPGVHTISISQKSCFIEVTATAKLRQDHKVESHLQASKFSVKMRLVKM